MSIACPTFESHVSSLDQVRAEQAHVNPPVKPPSSARRVEANRRNARRSTGPRTAKGKARVSRNALKHGLCSNYACLPSECDVTFDIFLGELEQEMRPRTVLQRNLFPQIANLLWRIRRLPEAEAALFVRESGKAAVDDNEKLPASEVLARRFSDDPSNGFMLMGRYERSMQNALLRMIRQFHSLQKTHPTTPYADGDGYCPRDGSEPAWSEEKARAQRERFEKDQAIQREAEQLAEADAGLISSPSGRGQGEGVVADASVSDSHTPSPQPSPGGRGGEDGKQTQSNPPQNHAGEAETEKCSTSIDAPVTKQSHCSLVTAHNLEPFLPKRGNDAYTAPPRSQATEG